MSKATKKKYVTKECIDELVLPTEHQRIVKIISSKGNNLHEVQAENEDVFLVSMPTKFRKNIWIKRGDFVITEPIEEGDKVKAEITHILYKDQIKHIKDEGLWPEAFQEEKKVASNEMIPSDMLPPSDEESDDGGEPLVANPNRPLMTYNESEGESSEEEDESDNSQDEKHYNGAP